MSTLVTGVTSGLGRYLLENTEGAEGLKRGQPLPERYFDRVVHCAHDHGDPHANLDMLQCLFQVPCGHFAYVSSVEVHKAYSLDNKGYGASKLRCEQFVRASHGSHAVVRLCAMLGPHMRENTLVRMLRGKKLSVTPDSTFAFVRHATAARWVKAHGTVTISGNIMTIQDIAAELGLCPEYGEFPYRTPPVRATHDTMQEIRDFVANDLPAVKAAD